MIARVGASGNERANHSPPAVLARTLHAAELAYLAVAYGSRRQDLHTTENGSSEATRPVESTISTGHSFPAERLLRFSHDTIHIVCQHTLSSCGASDALCRDYTKGWSFLDFDQISSTRCPYI
ncbi:hypothetical protein [Burkholderia anthina]|uniref:hypothetical protein n=1 Tax=Burkholderia anthina TaxID=179879 RepID=UPI0037BF3585